MGRRGAGEGSVRKRSDGRWEARRSIGPRGESRRISAYGATRREALDNLTRKVEERQRLVDLDRSADWTVVDLLKWWTTEELPARISDGRLADTTLRSYAQACTLHLVPYFDRTKVKAADLRPVHVRRMLTDLEKLSAHHRRYLHTVLRAAFSAADQYELVNGNPVARVAPPRSVARPRRQVTLDQARGVLAGAEGTRLEALWVLLLTAPLRPGEPLAAVAEDFVLPRNDVGRYTVRRNLVRIARHWAFHDTKGHRRRDIPLPTTTVEALRRHRAAMAAERLEVGTGWKGATIADVDGTVIRPVLVFCSPDGSPIHETWLQRELARVCERGGVERMTPHGLRHAANTLLQDAGVHPAVVQQLAGHRTAAMTDTYTGALDRACLEAVELLAARLR